MYNIHVYDMGANKLFCYKSDVLPIVGDEYVKPYNTDDHYKVRKRILHVEPDLSNVITISVEII